MVKELTLEATLENVTCVTAFVNEQLEAFDCEIKVQRQIAVVIDELFSNIARYAYGAQTGMATVRVEIQQNPWLVDISFIDSGMPFNPLTHEAPVFGPTAKERKSGGFGITIVKRSMDDVCYEYRDGCNITKITKTFR